MSKPSPRPDSIPGPRPSMISRFWRIFRLLAVLSIVVATAAVILVARGDHGIHIHMLIATALGTGLTVLIGTGLMTLSFLSAESGHDDEASDFHQENE